MRDLLVILCFSLSCWCTVNATECEKFSIEITKTSFEIYIYGQSILRHTSLLPAVDIGTGTASYESYLGNFQIQNDVQNRIPLTEFEVVFGDDKYTRNILEREPKSARVDAFKVLFWASMKKNLGEDEKFQITYLPQVSMECTCSEFGNRRIHMEIIPKHEKYEKYNRMWIKFSATKEEKVYGGGEQYTYFQMRGHAFPIWGREQGVFRDKGKIATKLADWIAGAGGDYHTTYWPQSTFVSSRLLYIHNNHSFYNVLNFTQSNYHELELWEDVSSVDIYIDAAKSWPSLLTKLTGFFGRQPPPPTWLYEGAVIGIQGGRDEIIRKYNLLKKRGVKISAIWIQDWSGKFITSLGKRVYWNWYLNEEFYWPRELAKKKLQEFRDNGVRFLTYINPHVIKDSAMYKHADGNGYFIKNSTGDTTHLVDFGEFDCATVDLTNPAAYEWYKGVLKDMLELGFAGWMADFGGEYLPVHEELKYYDDDMTPEAMHNHYSYMWAKMNKDAVEEAGKLDDAFVFMRSGYGSSPGQTLMAWAGDQNVDYFPGDGLPSVIPATLSLGMSGMGLSHSDIGGYVSLHMMVRNEELILRWAEMSVFTQVMRTHEGNRPDYNWQIYTTNKTIDDFAHLTNLHAMLAPYHRYVAMMNHKHGWPVQRPLFFHYPNDEASYDIQYQYIYGQDLLVAPVLVEGARDQRVYLPPDEWVYLWEDVKYVSKDTVGTYVTIDAPVGRPPVFFRSGSEWEDLFLKIRAEKSDHLEEPQGLSWSLLFSSPLIFIYLVLRKLFYYIILHF